MVKSAKLWREISLQYAKLAEPDASPSAVGDAGHGAGGATPGGHDLVHEGDAPSLDVPTFYKDGFCHRHYVLILCAMMIMCEWMDRSVLSIAMEAIKQEFALSDMQVGLIASSSLWMVPVAITFLGRLADYVPKSTMLGVGVFGWGACTLATGCASSFSTLILSRLFAGLSNCAGFPVAVSLLADFFSPRDMTTAMGYFNAGLAIGGLLGLALGGSLITHLGWRWAFWGVASPQIVLSVLLVFTVKEKRQPAPKQSWGRDIGQLLRMPALRFLMLGAFISGLMSGNHRFISALAERVFRISAQTVGLTMGVALGVTGVIASWSGGHAVDRCSQRLRDDRALLWCAASGDLLHLVFGSAAILAPNFGFFVFFLACAVCAAAMGQGVDTAVQMLGVGRRGTTQALLELNWSFGMGIGPFLGGVLSDSFQSTGCDSGCALAQSLLIVAGLGLAARATCLLMSAAYFQDDLRSLQELPSECKPCGQPCSNDGGPVDMTHLRLEVECEPQSRAKHTVQNGLGVEASLASADDAISLKSQGPHAVRLGRSTAE